MASHAPVSSYNLPLASGPVAGLVPNASAPASAHTFLVGTATTEAPNEVHVFDYDDEALTLRDSFTLRHSDAEITGITTSPAFSDRYFTVQHIASTDCGVATLWKVPDLAAAAAADTTTLAPEALLTLRIPTAAPAPVLPPGLSHAAAALAAGGPFGSPSGAAAGAGALPPAATLFGTVADPATARFTLPTAYQLPATPAGPRGAVAWCPPPPNSAAGATSPSASVAAAATVSKVLTRHAHHVYLWDIDQGSSDIGHTAVTSTALTAPLAALCWDPHRPGAAFYTASGRALRAWDVRTMAETAVIRQAHAGAVTAIDVNPNRPHTVVTVGTDGHVRVWDERRPLQPLLALAATAASLTAVAYNQSHDQLLITAGDDSVVALWSALSVSSVPQASFEPAQGAKGGPAGQGAIQGYGHSHGYSGSGSGQDQDGEGESEGSEGEVVDRMLCHMDEHEDTIHRYALNETRTNGDVKQMLRFHEASPFDLNICQLCWLYICISATTTTTNDHVLPFND